MPTHNELGLAKTKFVHAGGLPCGTLEVNGRCGDNSQRPIDPGAVAILILKLNTQKVVLHGQLTSYGFVV